MSVRIRGGYFNILHVLPAHGVSAFFILGIVVMHHYHDFWILDYPYEVPAIARCIDCRKALLFHGEDFPPPQYP